MEARAYLKYARIAPRKVQIVLDLIRMTRLWLSSSTHPRLLVSRWRSF